MDIASLRRVMGHLCMSSTARYLTPDLTLPGVVVDLLAALGVRP